MALGCNNYCIIQKQKIIIYIPKSLLYKGLNSIERIHDGTVLLHLDFVRPKMCCTMIMIR